MGDLKRLHSVVQTIAVSLSWAVSTLYVFAGGSVALSPCCFFAAACSLPHVLPQLARHLCSGDGSALL